MADKPIAFPTTPGDEEPPEGWKGVLSPHNRDAIEALAEAYGISEEAALNVAVSDSYDAKVANMREATGE